MLRFSEVQRQASEVSASARSTEELAHGSTVRRRALLGPRIRPGPAETPGRGSFDTLEHEVGRSRRFGHSFVLARIPCPLPRAEANGWHNRAAALLASLLRSVDSVWVGGGDVYLLLPESDRAQGTAALARIRGQLSGVLPEEALDRIPVVVFAPDECPTSGALLAALHGRLRDEKARTPGPPRKAGTPLSDPEGTGG
ncbi:MAG: hypothetical protein ACRDMU_03365 [Gaiellaceae bacterium]